MQADLPLSGIRIIEFSHMVMGPAAGLVLADLGADVIRIEPVGGDKTRSLKGSGAGYFAMYNRNKKSIRLNLKSEDGKAALRDLIAGADIFVEGFRPGVMKRLGFDYEAAKAIKPDIIYCSISAFGQDGALAHHPAHDMAVQALAGFLAVNDGPDGTPVVPGAPSADLAAGLTALSATLMALVGRDRTGEGAYIDCAMFDSLLPWCAHTAGSAIAGGPSPVSASQRSLGGAGFYQVYETKDGKHVALGGREIKFARNLLTALDRLDLLPLAEAPAGEQGELIAFLRETFATKTREEWVEWFADKDVAFSPVLNFREAFDEPHIEERGLIVEAEGGGSHVAPAIRFAGEEWQPAAVPAKGSFGGENG